MISRKAMIEVLELVREFVCAYIGSPTCDCKYGLSRETALREDGGLLNLRIGEQNGCPELGDLISTFQGMTDAEWKVMLGGGKGTGVERRVDFPVFSLPLEDDHWVYEACGEPPAPFRMGVKTSARNFMRMFVVRAAKYAVKASTMSGKANSFDPDALVQNMVTGFLGYKTDDGRPSAGLDR
jgi:hypothetical protein